MSSNEFRKKCMAKIYSYRDKDKKRWGIAGDISVKDIEELLTIQKNTCYVCKEPVLLDSWTPSCLYQFSIDRINEHLPHDRDNFLISCYHCNCTWYSREGAEQKICLHGCHTEEKVFKTTRKDELPHMEYLRLLPNTDRITQLKKAYQIIYESKKMDFDQRFKDFRKNILKLLLEKRLMFQRLFIIFNEGTKQLYVPTKEFMNELFDLRMRMCSPMHNYLYMSNTTIRPFDEWYNEIQTKKRFEERCYITISPKSISIGTFNESRENYLKLKLKKKIEKEFQNIYKRGVFEFNPIYLINISGLNEYFTFNCYSDIETNN